MRDTKTMILIALLVCLMVVMLNHVEARDVKRSNQSNAATETSGELLPDPELVSPDVHIRGNKAEYSYSVAEGSASLTWTHETTSEPRWNDWAGYEAGPACLDYVCIEQQFEWPFDTPPLVLRGVVECHTELSGDFASYTGAGTVHELTACIVNPAGQVTYIQGFPYGLDNGENDFIVPRYVSDIAWSDASEGPDPLEPPGSFRMLVVLCPGLFFRYGSGPTWDSSAGAVTVNVTRMSLEAMTSLERRMAEEITPVFNVTTNRSMNAFEDVRALTTSADGSIYLVTDILVGSETDPHGYGFMKFGPGGSLQWSRTPGGLSVEVNVQVMIEAVDGVVIAGTIYGAEEDYLYLGKWDSDGGLLWNHSYPVESLGGLSIAAAESSEFYVAWTEYETVGQAITTSARVVRFTGQGEITADNQIHLWNSSDPGSQSSITGMVTGIAVWGDYLYLSTTGGMKCLDSNLEEEWHLDGIVFNVETWSSGLFCLNGSLPGPLQLTSIGFSGLVQWTVSLDIEYAPGWYSTPSIYGMALGPRDTVHILCFHHTVETALILTSFDASGTRISDIPLVSLPLSQTYSPYSEPI
ncbi:hypothetical protein EU538_09190, partial [Candidatus Thorarchaeota archaeon]